MREETNELYGLKPDSRGKLRIRPKIDRDKKQQGQTWAALSNYKHLKGKTCPRGIFITLENWRSKKLMLDINTQNTTMPNEIHKYYFFDFKDFEFALKEIERQYEMLIEKVMK